ncbi:hypothetical protein EBI_26241 [Enterocytozoon bieneusi H348]|nr:hypothetical protein EBI_26241 [Enterocytozoon bieneusi H348]|eukprot:XP_002651224.1 hypothetical protein EBI_26241 [Enterocytozoon bieneusi H348]
MKKAKKGLTPKEFFEKIRLGDGPPHDGHKVPGRSCYLFWRTSTRRSGKYSE